MAIAKRFVLLLFWGQSYLNYNILKNRKIAKFNTLLLWLQFKAKISENKELSFKKGKQTKIKRSSVDTKIKIVTDIPK